MRVINYNDNSNIDWSKSHNGVMLSSFEETVRMMPETGPILENLKPHLEFSEDKYVIDVKVHMLMPKEFPCIPNWHYDFVPRDENLRRQLDKITGEKMYLWISSAPFTEFRVGKERAFIPAQSWIEFDQKDLHRGTVSEIHTWRCFIRAIPKRLIHLVTKNVGKERLHSQIYAAIPRRHTKIYIEKPNSFTW